MVQHVFILIYYVQISKFTAIMFIFTGNILTAFPDSFGVELTKMGFALSVAVSFPMVIFPCRTSINSILFARKVNIFLIK